MKTKKINLLKTFCLSIVTFASSNNQIPFMKKKLLSFIIICFIFGLPIHAQECSICGDYHGFNEFENKLIIRVKSNGNNNYYVREKVITASVTRYDDFKGYTFSVNSFSDGTTIISGWKKTSIGVYDCLKIEIKDKIMVYSFWAESDRGKVLGTPFVYTLYKDDDDW